MRIDDIRAHVKRQPFHPIRIYVSEQSAYDVYQPDLVLLGRAEVVLGIPNGRSDVYERLVYVDPVHITRIEPIPPRQTRRRASRKP